MNTLDILRLAFDLFLVAVAIVAVKNLIKRGRGKSAKFSTMRKPRALGIKCRQFTRDVFMGRKLEGGD